MGPTCTMMNDRNKFMWCSYEIFVVESQKTTYAHTYFMIYVTIVQWKHVQGRVWCQKEYISFPKMFCLWK